MFCGLTIVAYAQAFPLNTVEIERDDTGYRITTPAGHTIEFSECKATLKRRLDAAGYYNCMNNRWIVPNPS